MVCKLRSNQTIVVFCTEDLVQKKEFSGKTAILMSNFSFLLKSCLNQVVLVSISLFPIPALSIFITIELTYSIYVLVLYLRFQHLKSVLLIVPKILSSALIMICAGCQLWYYIQLHDRTLPLGPKSQNGIIKVIMVSSFIEYGIIFLEMLAVVRYAFQHHFRKKRDIKFRQFSDKKETFLEFKKREISSNRSGAQSLTFERAGGVDIE